MLDVEYVSFVLKKAYFFQLFVFPIICIMINSVRVINSIRPADTFHLGHISKYGSVAKPG